MFGYRENKKKFEENKIQEKSRNFFILFEWQEKKKKKKRLKKLVNSHYFYFSPQIERKYKRNKKK